MNRRLARVCPHSLLTTRRRVSGSRAGRRVRVVASFLGFSALAGAVALLAVPAAASAHDTWAHGEPIPDWVTKACCGPSDAHHLRPDQVSRTAEGYRIQGYPKIIYESQVLPSQDGEYWAFYSQTRDAGGQELFTSVFCFFAPSWG